MSRAYYELVHHAGYGRDDHLADEVIARAARILGLSGADGYIAAAAGFASHACPMEHAVVRLPVARGVAVRLRAAVRRAKREYLRRPDCCIAVVRTGEAW